VSTPDGWPEDDGGSVSDAEWNRLVEQLTSPVEATGTRDSFARPIAAAARAVAHAAGGRPASDQSSATRWATDLRTSVADGLQRALARIDQWLRKPPMQLTLPAGSQARFIIGREPACDMTLLDQTVSRWHASLKREDDGWLLTDLGSTNGTRLNGWRVNVPIVVSPGDLVSFGAATFVLTERPAQVRR